MDKHHPSLIDMTGEKYNHLLALEYIGCEGGQSLWKFKCDCGNEVVLSGYFVRSGQTKHCGCLTERNEAGERIGHFTLVEPAPHGAWRCRCDCGEVSILAPANLRKKKNPMCGKCAGRTKLRKNIKGQRFGKLVAVERAGVDKHRNAIWWFECDCGQRVARKTAEVQAERVRGEHSCGLCTGKPHLVTSEHLIVRS